MTGRTTLGLDLGQPWGVAEKVATYVASKVDFAMDEWWQVSHRSRAFDVLREAARHGDEFLATPEAADRDLCRALAAHLDSVARMLRDLALVDRRAFDEASLTVAALVRAGDGPDLPS